MLTYNGSYVKIIQTDVRYLTDDNKGCIMSRKDRREILIMLYRLDRMIMLDLKNENYLNYSFIIRDIVKRLRVS